MNYWVFTDLAVAVAAQQKATDMLPDDTLTGGVIAPVQITDSWADIIILSDGTFAFPCKPYMTKPTGGTVSKDISALLVESDAAKILLG